MSGPKVSKIKTKKEIKAECQSHLNVLSDLINEWRKCSTKHNMLSAEDENRIDIKLNCILKKFNSEKFADVQKDCLIEIEVIKKEIKVVKEQAIAKIEQDRSARRRLQGSAITLIKTLKLAKLPVPQELVNISKTALSVNEDCLPIMNAELSRISMKHVTIIAFNQDMTSHQNEIANSLSEESDGFQSLAEWKMEQDALYMSEISYQKRLDKLIAKIIVLDSDEMVQHYLDKTANVENEESYKQKSLLIDSLTLDVASRINTLEEIDNAISLMQKARSELRHLASDEAKNLIAILTKAIDQKDTSNAKSLSERAMSVFNEETKTVASLARREAILSGLAELGYEVVENMATVWADKGRLIVKKPHQIDYAIELAGVSDAERVQIQLVKFVQENGVLNVVDDSDMEKIWCSEFSKLRGVLKRDGNSMEIEKAIPIGVKSLKVVSHDLDASRCHSLNQITSEQRSI